MYLLHVKSENGSLPITPYGGGFLEQPVKTMQVLDVIQEVMWQKIAEENKKMERR